MGEWRWMKPLTITATDKVETSLPGFLKWKTDTLSQPPFMKGLKAMGSLSAAKRPLGKKQAVIKLAAKYPEVGNAVDGISTILWKVYSGDIIGSTPPLCYPQKQGVTFLLVGAMGKGNPGSTGDNGAGAKGKLQKGWKKWFAKNWEDAVEAGKSKVNVFPGVSGDHAANNRALIPGILPGLPKSPGINSKQKKVFEDFNKHIDLYWAKMIFGSLAAVDPSMRPPVPDERLPPNNEYFKYLEPQNNKGLSTGADGSIDNNGKRKGKPGWVMGPWVRDIQVEPVSNGSETYQEVAGPLDEEEWVLDDETGLPYNGGQELLMPIYADPPEVDPQTQEIIPERQVSMDPKVYGLKPAKPNPNKGKPLPEYGKAEMDENSILDTEDPEQVSHKKIFGTQHPTSRRQLVDKNILDGPPLDLCYYYKANSGSNFETWGPYEEAPKSSNWNYIVPTGLQSGLANAGTTERNPNGPSADGGTGDAGYSLPLKNSEYWGIRIASAKKQDGTPCSPADIAAGIPLPGGGGWITTTGETIMGPVPPARFGMKGFNSGAKARKIHKCFKSKRGSGCFNDDVKRSQSGGNSFKKNTSDGLSGGYAQKRSPNPISNKKGARDVKWKSKKKYYTQMGDHLRKTCLKHIKGTVKNGKYGGGMVLISPKKQIIPPYAPPPLKPPMPNTKKGKFTKLDGWFRKP